MYKAFLTGLLIFPASAAFACITCNRQVREGIYNSTFFPNLLTMLSAFGVLAVLVTALAVLSTRRHRARQAADPATGGLSPVPLTTAATILGIGAGGFLDGIVLHQILQWHEMLSNKVSTTNLVGKSINMFWDGVFHFFCLAVLLTGIGLLWKLLARTDINRSGKLLSGGLLLGWGLFNVVEGIIDHHLLQLHNVREFAPDHDPANYLFLAFSAALLLSGYLLVQTGSRHPLRIDR